ncbi:hypothetical protein AA14337_3032 [Acetobacter malorum DSM 14337]|uniref:Uncharacterized protein n=1 Tax=Acetobacter malorum DSM 14337 TaxID=1307910 RepID=A0ABQ0PZA5_9PROT|nr:hypothetical protein [Acetobacter malorum]KXV05625.1 hypothetical protein AD930_10815 [Acetobacter malorum]GBQ85283.1 hypothetical protein AA14337_3032 [Acetobacter malorum DSM 14337]
MSVIDDRRFAEHQEAMCRLMVQAEVLSQHPDGNAKIRRQGPLSEEAPPVAREITGPDGVRLSSLERSDPLQDGETESLLVYHEDHLAIIAMKDDEIRRLELLAPKVKKPLEQMGESSEKGDA